MTARPVRRRTRWVVATALAATVLGSWAAEAAPTASGCETSPDKCYSFTVQADRVPEPGQLVTYTGTLTNLSRGGSGVQLGSANVTWTPPDAFADVTAGTVAPRGTIREVGERLLELRDLGVAPGSSATFTFQAVSLRPVTVTFQSTAKQANRYAGSGNDLHQVSGSPTTTVVGTCAGDGSLTFDAYGCGAVEKAKGGKVCTGLATSGGSASSVTSCLQLPPVTPAPAASRFQVVRLATYLGGDGCPVDPLECQYVVQLRSKLDGEYDADHTATLTIVCGDQCSALPIFFQEDETSGIKEPLLPCLPIGPVPSLLSGSLACFTDNGDGTVTVLYVSAINDWKVMS